MALSARLTQCDEVADHEEHIPASVRGRECIELSFLRRPLPAPGFMVASGRNAPNHLNKWLRGVVELDDRSFFRELQGIGGVPKGLSFAMAKQFLNVVRNDQAMARDYDPGETRINVPILVLAGR